MCDTGSSGNMAVFESDAAYSTGWGLTNLRYFHLDPQALRVERKCAEVERRVVLRSKTAIREVQESQRHTLAQICRHSQSGVRTGTVVGLARPRLSTGCVGNSAQHRSPRH